MRTLTAIWTFICVFWMLLTDKEQRDLYNSSIGYGDDEE
jgi:hypothetical protein